MELSQDKQFYGRAHIKPGFWRTTPPIKTNHQKKKLKLISSRGTSRKLMFPNLSLISKVNITSGKQPQVTLHKFALQIHNALWSKNLMPIIDIRWFHAPSAPVNWLK